jgi:hypothetical protein
MRACSAASASSRAPARPLPPPLPPGACGWPPAPPPRPPCTAAAGASSSSPPSLAARTAPSWRCMRRSSGFISAEARACDRNLAPRPSLRAAAACVRIPLGASARKPASHAPCRPRRLLLLRVVAPVLQRVVVRVVVLVRGRQPGAHDGQRVAAGHHVVRVRRRGRALQRRHGRAHAAWTPPARRGGGG